MNPSLVLVQPRKTCPCINERLLMGRNYHVKNKIKATQLRFVNTLYLLLLSDPVPRNMRSVAEYCRVH